jgi:hypothetical protein
MAGGGIGRKIGLAAMLLTVSTVLAWAAEPYSIEPVKISAASLPKSITDDLNPEGVLLFKYENGLKKSICEIFWAKMTPAVAVVKPSTNNGYASIRQGALIGVIHLLPEATDDYYVDFSNQALKPGYYTMRYAVLSAGIGEHGPVPGDFVVLSPITLDRDPARALTLDEMIRFGKLVSHGDEAARMKLVRAEKTKNPLPEITMDDAGAGTLHFKLHLTPTKGVPAQELGLALLVVTPKPDLGGS